MPPRQSHELPSSIVSSATVLHVSGVVDIIKCRFPSSSTYSVLNESGIPWPRTLRVNSRIVLDESDHGYIAFCTSELWPLCEHAYVPAQHCVSVYI